MPVRLTETIVKSEPAPDKGTTRIYDSECKGFGCRVYAPTDRHPHGIRSFFFSYWVRGKESLIVIGRFPDWTVVEARQAAKELRKRVDRGEDPSLERRERREAITVAELAQRYREEHLAGKPLKTVHDNGVHLDQHILPFKVSPRAPKMGDRLVSEIHSGDIEALHKAITKGGNPVLANRVLATCSKMFSLALKTKAGEDKPWRDATLGNPCSGVARNSEEGRERFFSEAEMAAISDALNEYSNQERKHPIARESAIAAANCIRFIMLTGCRPAEAMAAKWEQVDEQPGFWIKPSAHTKQRKVHKLALSPPALELIGRLRDDRQKQLKAGKELSDWIFPGQVEGDHLKQLRSCWDFVRERATISLWESSEDEAVAGLLAKLGGKLERAPTVEECEAAAKAIKIKLPGGIAADRIYDLRHSFASFGTSGSVSLQVIGKLLGHTQARTTQRYAHLADEAAKQAAAKIGGIIHNAGNGHRNVTPLRGRG